MSTPDANQDVTETEDDTKIFCEICQLTPKLCKGHDAPAQSATIKPPKEKVAKISPSNKTIIKTRIKESVFVDEMIKSGGKGAESYRKASNNPKMITNTASTGATRLLQKEHVIKSIEDRLPSDNVLASIIKRTIKLPTPKEISHADKHKYIETALKVKGHLANNDKTPNVNVGLVINR